MNDSPSQPALTLFYDGACPLCRREVAFVQRRDRDRRIALVDIAAADFEAAAYGLDARAVHAQIHALDADGTVLRGLAVFRRLYAVLGLGWLWAPTAWPVLRPICDACYRLFARVRPHLPGRKRCNPDGTCRTR